MENIEKVEFLKDGLLVKIDINSCEICDEYIIITMDELKKYIDKARDKKRKEKMRAYQKMYYEQNKEKVKERVMKRYRRKHPKTSGNLDELG